MVMEHGTAADVIVTPVGVGVIAQRGISCIIPKIKNRGGFPRFFFVIKSCLTVFQKAAQFSGTAGVL